MVCGLAGFVGAGRGVDDAELALKQMVETLACRGPDAQATWIGGRAALGHTRLAVIDREGGWQPLVAGDPDEPAAVLAFTGEIYNHRELRARLETAGHRFRTRGDAEVVLAAYLEWGEDLAGRLEGMFAFAVWDARRQRLVLVRDRLGVKPLYYQRVAGQILFGSEPKALLAHPRAQPAIDLDGLRELILRAHPMISTPGRAVFAGMAEVPPGHVLVAVGEHVTLRRYWSLTPREHTEDLPSTIEAVRSLLERAVGSHLEAEVPRCTLLSGGLDSSVIAALAQGGPNQASSFQASSFQASPFQASPTQDGTVQDTVSVDFGSAQDSAADAMRRSWDAPYVRLMAERLGTRHRDVVIAPQALADPELRAQVVAARDGLSLGDFDASLLLLFRAVRQQHTVALSGEAADEVFGGYRWFQSSPGSPDFPWGAVIERADLTRLLDPSLARALDLAGHRGELYAAARAELDHLPGADERERGLRLNSYLNLTRFLPGLLERSDRLSMACAVEVRVPFCDHRLVEYVFNVPWDMKTFDGREKSLLRAAAAGLVPDEILRRRKSPYPMVRDPVYRAALTDQVRDLIGGGGPAMTLLNGAAVRRLLLDAGTVDRFPREGLEFVLDLDRWLRAYQPRLAL
jgi:asparagine synthase (glutamine-hydrolysing)